MGQAAAVEYAARRVSLEPKMIERSPFDGRLTVKG